MQQILEQIKNLLCFNPYCGWIIIIITSFAASFLLLLIFKLIIEKFTKIEHKSVRVGTVIFTEILKKFNFLVLSFWFFSILSKFLNPPLLEAKIFQTVLVLVTGYQFALWGLSLLKRWHLAVLSKKIDQDPQSSAALGLLYRFIQAAFLIIILLLALSNLDINIGALLTGLGIGGIAVALAAQNILVDLLASISIILDKPFCVGDLIYTGNEKGVVEQIGIKTTRLRSVTGEQLIISNKNLLESRIQNFKRMTQRRVVQKITLSYGTKHNLLNEIPLWIKNIIEQKPSVKFDHCNLIAFGDSGLVYELVFFVLSPDSSVFLDNQHEILLDIFKKFHSENISFAMISPTIQYNHQNQLK